MNKKIRELALKSGFSYEPIMDKLWITDPPNVIMISPLIENFSELLIRQCATIADQAEPYKAEELILKHFGVEG